METTSAEWETKENTLARLRHIRTKLLAMLVMRSLEKTFSMYSVFTLLNGSYKWQTPIFFLRQFSLLTRGSAVKWKHATSVFPDLFSARFSKILVIAARQFGQSLDICPAFQRTCLVDLFVPCIHSGSLLVMKQTKTVLEKGITQCILPSLQKSIAYWKLSGLASKSKDSLIFWDAVTVVSGWVKHAQHASQSEQQLWGSSVTQCISWTVKSIWRGSVSEFQAWKESELSFSFLNHITFVLFLNYQGPFPLHFSLICGQKLIWKRRT